MTTKYANPALAYSKLLNMIESEDTIEDVYEALLKTEANILNIADRVATSNHLLNTDGTVLQNQSLNTVILSSANMWKNMFMELFVYKEFNTVLDVVNILVGNERKIYFGILLCLIAFFLFFIDISSN